MKLLALALLLLNLSFWYGVSRFPVGSTTNKAATGTLPRVEGLKAPASVSRALQGASQGRSCVTVGWFEAEADAEALAEKSRALEAASYQIKSQDRQMPPLHWVIVPPQPEEVALKQLKKLRQMGVESYLVTQGEHRNAISLGLFESRKAAISVLEEKKRQNLNAVLANFTRNQISYALSFEVSSELVEKQVRAVETDYGNNFDFIEISTCKGIATPAKTP